MNMQRFTFFCFCGHTGAFAIIHQNICHGRIFINRYIRKLFHLCKKFARNLLSCDILVKKDSVTFYSVGSSGRLTGWVPSSIW